MRDDEQVLSRTTPYRFSARTRLACSYALMVVGCGAILLTVLVLYLGYGPEYAFGPAAGNNGSDSLVIVPADGGAEGAVLSVEVQSRDDLIRLLVGVSAVVLVVLAGASSLLAWWVAGRMLRPLSEINRAARLAADGRLDHRIGLSGPRDEIVELAQTFDMMLASMERFTNAQRRFAANASHELRTPLAANKTMLEVALARGESEHREMFKRLAALNERSIQTVEALLDLADAESGHRQRADVDLAELFEDALALHEHEAAARTLTMTSKLEPSSTVGDERLFSQLAGNLVQNAIRHNREGGSVEVRTESIVSTDGVLFARAVVENSGQVIDPADVGSLIEPFATGSERTRGDSRGLGLAIVSAIVNRAEGTLELTARPEGGLRVVVTLPAGAST